jgi:hypothetical protein
MENNYLSDLCDYLCNIFAATAQILRPFSPSEDAPSRVMTGTHINMVREINDENYDGQVFRLLSLGNQNGIPLPLLQLFYNES